MKWIKSKRRNQQLILYRRLLDYLTLTPIEAATLLRIGKNNVYDLIQQGRLRHIRMARKLIVPRSAIDEFLSQSDHRNSNGREPSQLHPLSHSVNHYNPKEEVSEISHEPLMRMRSRPKR